MPLLIPWTVSCLLVLILCLVRPHADRIFLGMFLVVMAVGVIAALVVVTPEQFVALGTNDTEIGR